MFLSPTQLGERERELIFIVPEGGPLASGSLANELLRRRQKRISKEATDKQKVFIDGRGERI
jgi:hypothetical protein